MDPECREGSREGSSEGRGISNPAIDPTTGQECHATEAEARDRYRNGSGMSRRRRITRRTRNPEKDPVKDHTTDPDSRE